MGVSLWVTLAGCCGEIKIVEHRDVFSIRLRRVRSIEASRGCKVVVSKRFVQTELPIANKGSSHQYCVLLKRFIAGIMFIDLPREHRWGC